MKNIKISLATLPLAVLFGWWVYNVVGSFPSGWHESGREQLTGFQACFLLFGGTLALFSLIIWFLALLLCLGNYIGADTQTTTPSQQSSGLGEGFLVFCVYVVVPCVYIALGVASHYATFADWVTSPYVFLIVTVAFFHVIGWVADIKKMRRSN